ncbi:MAG: proteasome assembly chaperone family protein [Candidatus Bathyarchaeota archaeon]|nr:MAG: proteasome assembly chaperone family protein [Candidatus Bathyarchaeota archaeon]
MTNKVQVIETHPITRCRYCLIGVPDVGLVGTIALSYLIHSLQLDEVGYLESDALPPMIVIHNSDPKPLIRLYQRDDVILIASEIPIEQNLLTPLAQAMVFWAHAKQVDLLVTLSGIAVQNRLDLEKPQVYGIGTSPTEKTTLQQLGIPLLQEGFIAGLHAVITKEAIRQRIPALMLLAQAHLQYPDPEAAAYLINTVNQLLNWNIDTAELLTQGEEYRLKMRALMQRTQQEMQRIPKDREQEIPPMYV